MAFGRQPYGKQPYGRQPYGGGSFGGFSYFPPVLKALLGLNVGIFLIQVLFGEISIGNYTINSWIHYRASLYPLGSKYFAIWQFLTYMFLHGGLFHLLMNMIILWMFGVELEHQWGSKKFLIYYLLCGFGGALAHLIISPLRGEVSPDIPLVGASGAIFGVLAAFGLMYPERYMYLYFLVPIKAKYAVIGFIVLEVFAGFGGGSGDNVAHLAHVGGAITGIIYIMLDVGLPQLMSRLRIGGRNKSSAEWEDSNISDWDNRSSGRGTNNPFRRQEEYDDEPVEAEYYDVKNDPRQKPQGWGETRKGRVITQEEVDKILDKIAASGYQNLTEEEREILFEASRRMDEKR